MSIRKRIWSAVMAPERLHTAGFKQFSFKTVSKCQKRISWTGVDINRVPDCRNSYTKHTRLETVKDIKDDVLRCNTGQWTHNMVAEQWHKMMSHFRCTSLQQVQTAMQRRYLGWQVSALQSRLDYLHNTLNHSRVLQKHNQMHTNCISAAVICLPMLLNNTKSTRTKTSIAAQFVCAYEYQTVQAGMSTTKYNIFEAKTINYTATDISQMKKEDSKICCTGAHWSPLLASQRWWWLNTIRIHTLNG